MRCSVCNEPADTAYEGNVLCHTCWYKPFQIPVSVCRVDIADLLPDFDVAQLDDRGMQKLAEGLADAYLRTTFSIDLRTLIEAIQDEIDQER